MLLMETHESYIHEHRGNAAEHEDACTSVVARTPPQLGTH